MNKNKEFIIMLAFYLSLIENHDDDDDFLKIYYQYKQPMYNIALSYLRNIHDCEDAMQIAFSGIAKNMETIKKLDKEKLEIYVFKCVKNAALNVLEKKNSIYNNVYSMDEQFHELSSEEDLVESTVEKELLKEIVSFIGTMDEKYRDVLSLYFLHELTFREIADALDKPVSTIKDRFHKGHKLVIEKFKEYRK